jgi:lantibiotic modifying enzyme
LPSRTATEAADPLVAAAARIGREVIARASVDGGGTPWWPGCAGRLDLYGGSGGIALFLAALAAATGRQEWADAARGALRGVEAACRPAVVESAPVRLGCRGVHSVAYAIALCGELLGEPRLVERGRSTARFSVRGAIEADDLLDVEGGSAGALLALLALDPTGSDDDLRRAAAGCARHLVTTQIRTGPDRGGWPAGADRRARPGFAHGAAGIAAALARWAGVSGDGAAAEAAREAWAFERRVHAGSGRT